MAISLIKEFKQKQKISLTPLLKKSIDLLQLSRYELIQKIDQEIEINPFVEKEITDDFEFDENYNDADFDFNLAAVENLRESLINQVNDLSLNDEQKEIAPIAPAIVLKQLNSQLLLSHHPQLPGKTSMESLFQ